MIYNGKYGSFYAAPFFSVFVYLEYLFLENISDAISSHSTFIKISAIFFAMASLVLIVDIVRGLKISKEFDKRKREEFKENNKEILFTLISASHVIYATPLGIEFYNSKNIFIGVLSKFRKKDFYVPFEEIVSFKVKGSFVSLNLRDETKLTLSTDSNKKAANALADVIKEMQQDKQTEQNDLNCAIGNGKES